MNLERLVAGLDIGSAKTTAIIAEVTGEFPRSPMLKVLGVGIARTTGLRRGVVSDIGETTRSIKKALSDAERMAGAQVAEVYVGIAGEHVEAMTSKGIVAVNGDEISVADVDRANQVARAMQIPGDRELLHAIPQEYTVDRNVGVRDPVGMIGMRLETEMYLVTIGSSPAMNLRKAVERAGYQVKELVLEPLASALSVLTEDEKELGVALVEMGAGTTDLAIFHEGKIRHLGTLAYGGNNVTNDIVHGLGVTQADAERLKERHGHAYEPGLHDPSETISLPSTQAQGERQIPRELLAHIIHQRMDEIFDMVQREIANAGYQAKLPAGLVLSGGAAEVEGIAELAQDVFGAGVRVGSPTNLAGLSDSVEAPRFATVVGLAQYGAGRMAAGGPVTGGRRSQLGGAGVDKLATKVRTWLQDFF